MPSLREITHEYLDPVRRAKWIDRLVRLGETRDITAVIGPRRVGKTFLMLRRALELERRGRNVIYVSFDEPELRGINARRFAELVRKEYTKGKVYLFLDEVQEWKNWDHNLRWLHDVRDFSLYVSGSSSTLGTLEIPSRLRGRYTAKTLLPLSFREIVRTRKKLTFRERGLILRLLDEYMQYGGFPEIWLERRRDKVLSLLDTIFYRDIVERFRIRDLGVFREFLYFVISNYSNPFTYRSLRRALRAAGVDLDVKTVINYLDYLQQAFLLKIVHKYSHSTRDRIRGEKKLYLVDHVFANLFDAGLDTGRKMENIVYVELLRRKYYEKPLMEIYYYRTENYEVDFMIREGTQTKQLIEVTYSEEAINEKADKLAQASTSLNCKNLLIITWNTEETVERNGLKIQVKPLWKWLLKF